MITWITPAGNIAVIVERVTVDIPLFATSDIGIISYEVISGNLPRGLRLVGNRIKGSPVEVRRYTESRFVIRASDGRDLEDRTFSISVDGSDVPQWITKEGFLNVGNGNSYFVLDNAYVNFHLEAIDPDINAGDELEYYLSPAGGDLPPGLSLSRDGIISGFTDPIFALESRSQVSSYYDTQGYDIVPLDVVARKTNGFDSFFYDNVTYDYNEPNLAPRRLSRFYTFIVVVSDGSNEIKRIFKIWVVTDDFLKSDNSIIQVDTNLFLADSSSNRVPLWITDSYLGRIRADNYVTIYLDVYDPPSLSGTITYFLLDTNPGSYTLLSTGETSKARYELTGESPTFRYVNRGSWNSGVNYRVGDLVTYISQTFVCQKDNVNQIPSIGTFWNKDFSSTMLTFTPSNASSWTVIEPETASELPPGMSIDTVTGEVAGRVPYQQAVTKNYKFTIQAVDFPLTLTTDDYVLVGDWNSTRIYVINEAVRYNGFVYIALQNNRGVLPVDGPFWNLGVATAEKTFSVDIIGEIDSSISWVSDELVGTIKPNQPSTLFVEATSLIYGGKVVYEFVEGRLPPGLELISDGIIKGKVKQFADNNGPGLTRFFDRDSSLDDSVGSRTFTTTFDFGATSFDRKFMFKIKARDTANFAEDIKQFYIQVQANDTKTYANLYFKAFQSKEKRLSWYDFITDNDIFRIPEIYRYGDLNFGVQSELKVLLYAGIESVEAVKYVQAMSRNHYRKQLRFGDVKYAVAKDPVTQIPLYEVVYVDVVDEYEKNGVSISRTVNLPTNINSKVLISYDSIRIDSDIPFVSDSDHRRIFPNSFKNMRNQIKAVGERDREFLPLWMRSIQPDGFVETGFVKALVLAFVKPGNAESTISRIEKSGFDFKSIDFTADRYLIDVLDGEIENKYLAFPQRGEKLP